MSAVSGVILMMSCVEDYVEPSDGTDDTYPLVDRVNAWLREMEFGPLLRVDGEFGGGKASQTIVHGAAFRGFPEAAFEEFVMGLPWVSPANLVLVVQPEDGPTKVFHGGAVVREIR